MSSFVLLDSTLGEICNLVTDGTHDTPKPQSDGYPLIKAKEIGGGIIDFMNCDFILEAEHLKVISRSKPEKGDTLFAHIGASLGEAAFVNTTREFSIKNIALFKPNPRIINGRYLYYLVISPQFQELAKSARTGSAQPFLSLGHLRSHRVRFNEKIEEQKKIAAILSAYDDLIENNLRRIKILEEMAQTLYRDWFINFRFPGRQKVKMVDSPSGKIPEGWRVTGILESPYFDFIGQNIHPYEGKKVYYATADIEGIQITGKGIEYEYNEKPSRAQKEPELNSVWFARMQDTYKVVAFTSANVTLCQKCMLSSGFAGFRSVGNLTFGFLFYTINSKDFHERKDLLCTGATQRSLTNEGLGRINVVMPPRELVEKFGDVTQPSIDLILTLFRQISILRQTRDLLLPKLISGELDISELDIIISEANA